MFQRIHNATAIADHAVYLLSLRCTQTLHRQTESTLEMYLKILTRHVALTMRSVHISTKATSLRQLKIGNQTDIQMFDNK